MFLIHVSNHFFLASQKDEHGSFFLKKQKQTGLVRSFILMISGSSLKRDENDLP